MASKEEHYVPGSMDISQHQRTYSGFLTGSKYGLILVLGIVVFMAIFRTHT